MAERYTAEWDAIQHEPGDPDGPEAIEIFHNRCAPLLPNDLEWMTLANVVRDAVSAFEIYVVKALDEVLKHHAKARVKEHKNPVWPDLADYYKVFGIDIAPAPVTHVRDLRHLLTHNRGELRTDEQRKRFADSQDPFASDVAALSPKTVLEHLDVLAGATRQIDPIMWAYLLGRPQGASDPRRITEETHAQRLRQVLKLT